MSIRYVYDVYNTTVSSKQSTSRVDVEATAEYNFAEAFFCNDYELSVAEDREGNKVTKYKAIGDYPDSYGSAIYYSGTNPSSAAFDTAKYKYVVVLLGVVVSGQEGIPFVKESYLLELQKGTSGAYWHISFGAFSSRKISVWNNNSNVQLNEADPKPFYKSGGTISKGSTLLYSQSTISKSLATGPFTSGNTWRWRTYKGSDTIDPTAVTYSKSDLYPGDSVEISVAPSTPTYGGTISYQYQYSLDGGSTWTNIGSKTTETTASVTIPEGAKQFQARVTASDSWGFTSTTPVAGPSLGVSQLKAYAAVSGISRAGIKMYATVNGKIREIQKGYATINGKIRKMF